MKKSFFLFMAIICLFASCKKDDEFDENSYSNQIILKDLELSGDSVTLNWTKLDTLNFSGYLIIRKDNKDLIVDPSNTYSSQYTTFRIYDPNITTYTDKDIPVTPYLDYQVIGMLSKSSPYSNYGSYNYIFSNLKTLERNWIKAFDFNPLDIIPDLDNNRFYFMEQSSGTITIFDYEKLSTVKSVTSNATIGYCSIGTNGTKKELYVPRSDGWVFVYDAGTLEITDQIAIGRPASCVINNKGKLYISTDAWTDKPLKVFDRSSKMQIAETGDFEDTRLRQIPNTNTSLIEVTTHISPIDLDYYQFDSNGNFVSHKNDRYHGDYPIDPDIFRFFPDGRKFITAEEGAIYDTDLNYLTRLPQGDLRFSDYAFSSDASTIYCACGNRKSIVSYSVSGYAQQKEYKTTGYPYRIYRKNNTLICISKSTVVDPYIYSYNPGKLFIEIITL